MDKTFDQLFTELKAKYANIVPAAALYWKHANDYGVRIEVPTLMKEFKNGVNLGKDPEGYLFYNGSGGDLRTDGTKMYYNINFTRPSQKEQYAVTTAFWNEKPGVTAANAYAEFLAKDPNATVNYTVDQQEGQWYGLNLSTTSAQIDKTSTENTITITMPSIKKQVTFTVNDTTHEIHASGYITFKDISLLHTGAFFNFNADRITFQDSSWTSPDYVAYFMPIELNIDSLSHIADCEGTNANWTDL